MVSKNEFDAGSNEDAFASRLDEYLQQRRKHVKVQTSILKQGPHIVVTVYAPIYPAGINRMIVKEDLVRFLEDDEAFDQIANQINEQLEKRIDEVTR